MHATYCFLISVDPENPDAGEFDSYATNFCDDNNWYQGEALVLEDGTLVPLCPEDDYRGRNDFQAELAGVPQEERWAYAIKFAEDCTNCELQWGLAGFYSYDLSCTEHINLDNFEEIAREKLRECADEMDPYRIRWIGAVLEQIKYMSQRPFSCYIVDPYKSIRATDLTDGQDGSKGILFVDIHT